MVIVIFLRHSHQHLGLAAVQRTQARVLRGVRRRRRAAAGLRGAGPAGQGQGGGARGLAGLGTQITGGGRGLGKKNIKPTCSGCSRYGQTVLCVTRSAKIYNLLRIYDPLSAER